MMKRAFQAIVAALFRKARPRVAPQPPAPLPFSRAAYEQQDIERAGRAALETVAMRQAERRDRNG